MTFVQEKIIVVELHGVDIVLALQVREDGSGPLRALHFLTAFVNRNHSTELAAERTTDAGVMDGGAATQKSGKYIFFGVGQTMIGRPGKIVGRTHGPLGVMHAESKVVLVRQTANAAEVPWTAQSREQLQECVFSLPANGEIDVRRIERG